MATGKRYYWIKLKDSFITSDTVDFLMGQKDGANYVVLYQMLCLKTINTNGKLGRELGEVMIKYDVEKIQRDCKWFSADTIRIALMLYKKLGLVYEDQDGVLTLTNHADLVGSETDWKEQKAAQRAKNLPKLTSCRRLNANTLLLPSGKQQYVDEKRYGGNGMLAFDLAGGKCEMCGSYENLVIHHANGYSNEPDDLYVLCTACHGIAHSPSTSPDWLHHTRSGQMGGHVHPEIRDKRLDIDHHPPTPFFDGDDDGDKRPDFNTLEAYASSNLQHLSPRNMEELVSFRDELPDDVIRWAIDEACAHGAPRYSYVRATLNRLIDDGIRTVGDAKSAMETYGKDSDPKKDNQPKDGTNAPNNSDEVVWLA